LNIWAFVAVALPLVLTPGVSTAVVLRTSVTRGTAAAIVTAAGLNASSLTYGVMAALGLPAVAQRWPITLVILRYAGGAYLLWLGASATARGLSRFRGAASSKDQPPVKGTGRGVSRAGNARLFIEGYTANTLNPPIAAFYFLILPQFVPAGDAAIRATLVLTVVHVSMAWTWHVAWAIAGGALAARLSAGRPRASLEIATGVALLVLALAILF
jgi:threonine/homoserine/homoserine lactone efflux protein